MPPGLSIEVDYYHATGDIGRTRNVARGGRVTAGLEAVSNYFLVTPTYALEAPALGAQVEIALAIVAGNYSAATSVSRVGAAGATRFAGSEDSLTAIGDLSPAVTGKWSAGVNNFMGYLSGNVPVGAYDPARLATIGLGFWAIDGGIGYTYFDGASGREFSAVLGATYNFMNPSTVYQSGIDLHLDLSASQYVMEQLYVGLAGYFYQQVTGDSGEGARLGPFMGRVAGIGPQVGYDLSLGGRDVTLGARGYYEFAAENRPAGWTAWLTFSAALGAREKKASSP